MKICKECNGSFKTVKENTYTQAKRRKGNTHRIILTFVSFTLSLNSRCRWLTLNIDVSQSCLLLLAYIPPGTACLIKHPQRSFALWITLLNVKVIDPQSTEVQWREIAAEFDNKWNFPHALRAIDGKHVVMQAPHNNGSEHFTYKRTHSIVLIAVCNARYELAPYLVGNWADFVLVIQHYVSFRLHRMIEDNLSSDSFLRLSYCPTNSRISCSVLLS